ncbi:hypothetical protein CIT292_08501 [Citrobacter youngae ATCC 29220]|uniref:Uncharacterized protein n=1 Tax=Citrobacter youngae ATCC 29220 TaxID=500640 RepID=D4BDD4_9ENTR|nr:hypothetical protein CIT292_08501 [Citrobacter youngae ATCC 29220]
MSPELKLPGQDTSCEDGTSAYETAPRRPDKPRNRAIRQKQRD